MKTSPALADDDLRERFEIILSGMDFEALENHLKLENGTLKEIFNSDTDWAMIIKIGVLTEAVLDSFLSVGFETIPQEFFAKLSVGGRAGKSELALHSGLIDKATKIRIDTIMQVRNIFAHKLSFINKSFMDYYKSIENGREIFINLYQFERTKKKDKNKISGSDDFELNARDLRHMLWGGFVVTLKCMTQCIEFFSTNKHIEKAELLNAYLSRDYSRETQQKVRRIGNGVISELDGINIGIKKQPPSAILFS